MQEVKHSQPLRREIYWGMWRECSCA